MFFFFVFCCIRSFLCVSSMVAWLSFDTSSVLSTCKTKRSVLTFLLWMYESTVLAELAEEFNLQTIPEIYIKQTGLVERLRKLSKCGGEKNKRKAREQTED